MATIFTVHGTRPKGAEFPSDHGDEWWQIGGGLDRELRTYVGADDGEINVRPVIWDGANSELSRRAAATKLLTKTKEEDERGRRYVLIGHSHGGSVILNAAIQSTFPTLFPAPACVVTVGTPFIRFRRSRFLFNRLGFVGKVTFATLAASAAYHLINALNSLSLRGGADPKTGQLPWVVLSLIISLSPLIVAYIILCALSPSEALRRNDYTVQKSCRAHLNGHWHCLHDRNDEAIHGLGAVHRIRPRIFSSYAFMRSYLFVAVAAMLSLIIFRDSIPVTDLVIVVAAISISIIFTFFSIRSSSFLTTFFDNTTWNAIKRSLFGADANGEIFHQAADHPEWMAVGFSPLPIDLSREINEFSDREAAKSIPRLRSAIADLIQLSNVADPNKSVAEYLTWNELVHTSYFSIPRFRKLVYFIIAHSEGFKPTQAFLDDPDYPLAARWHREIQPAEAKALG